MEYEACRYNEILAYQYNDNIQLRCLLRDNVYCLSSIHGLVRGENMELGRDSDTGGQVSFTRALLCDRNN